MTAKKSNTIEPLVPYNEIPKEERWLWDNSKMLSSMINSLDKDTAKKALDLGSFHALKDSSIDETLYLMKNPANYAHLMQSLENVNNCQVLAKNLLED